MSSVVVIGAGVGGLAVAARLGALGHRVTVCEAAEVVGGKLGRAVHETSAGRFTFDTGPSLLAWPEVFDELFAATGGPVDLPRRRLDPLYRYCFADGSVLDLPATAADQVEAIAAVLGARAGTEWADLLRRGERIWRATEDQVLRRPLRIGPARPADVAAIAPWSTLRQVGQRTLSDPRLRLVLDRYATFTGSDPRRAPAALAVLPFLEAARGGWYVDGGLYRLAEALADRAVERGATIRCRARVVRIETAGRTVTGVRLADGERIAADVVISDADAGTALGSLLDRPARGVPVADSLSGFVLLLAVRDPPPGPQHTVLFGAAPYDDEFDAVFGGRLVADPAIYLGRPDDPATAPPGTGAWFVLVNAARLPSVDWAAEAERYAGAVLARLAERGIDVRDRVLSSETITPADLTRRTLAPGGAIYGSALHGRLAAFRRPTNRTRIRGLYLVGGSAHPGGGLPLVALSAGIVADLIGPA